ncbi:hypothetical protein ACFFRR_009661 [Megaselia abdita]
MLYWDISYDASSPSSSSRASSSSLEAPHRCVLLSDRIILIGPIWILHVDDILVSILTSFNPSNLPKILIVFIILLFQRNIFHFLFSFSVNSFYIVLSLFIEDRQFNQAWHT